MALIDVERTYLQLLSLADLDRQGASAPDEVLAELRPCPVSVARRLYHDVGARYHWRDRLAISDADLHAYLAREDVRVFVARSAGRDDGFFELVRHADGSVEIAYFGLMGHAQGRGLGRWMLVEACRAAFAWGASRVWLHTCTLDAPAALPNYRARGFVPYRMERYQVEVPDAGA